MSSSIWTQCAGDSRVGPLRLTAYRAVESQHQVSTRKLVDTADEQALLEELIDDAKPPDVTRGKLHYLLATPFRYPPLRHGSRFATRHERGLWYGSETIAAAFAEVAYYRFVFLEGTRADLGAIATQLTAFSAPLRSEHGVDLTAEPFDAHRSRISSPSRYFDSQALGAAMRQAGVELFRYRSARDPDGGVNVGAFTPAVFGGARTKPRNFQTWHCTATQDVVELLRRDYFAREAYSFPRSAFEVEGRLPSPAI